MLNIFKSKVNKCLKFNQRKIHEDFTPFQLEELKQCEHFGIDKSLLAYPELKPYEMAAVRNAFVSGAAPSAISNLISLRINDKVSHDEFENLIKKSIYIIDLDYLVSKYTPLETPCEPAKIHILDSLYGSVFGDIAGSRYEFCLDISVRKRLNISNCLHPNSCPTDDTILTCATAIALKEGTLKILTSAPELNDYTVESTYPFAFNPYTTIYRENALRFPDAGYGPGFFYWASNHYSTPYGSLGNGSAMRVSPIGLYFDNIKDVIVHAVASAACTHNHPEGIKGAVVTAVSVWMARSGYSKEQIYQYMIQHYKGIYGFVDFSIDELYKPKRPGRSDTTCMFTVPAAIICFCYSDCYENVIDLVLSFFGDTDTIGVIAGAVAGAYYGVPGWIIEEVEKRKPCKIFQQCIDIFQDMKKARLSGFFRFYAQSAGRTSWRY